MTDQEKRQEELLEIMHRQAIALETIANILHKWRHDG